MPGDRVMIVGDIPSSLTNHNKAWVRGTTFVVRHAEAGDTLDVQLPWSEDYLDATMQPDAVEPTA